MDYIDVDEFRKFLLFGDILKVKKLAKDLRSGDDLYKLLCEFHQECETKGVCLPKGSRRFITDVVMEYRFYYPEKHKDAKCIENIPGRIEFIKGVLTDYQHFEFPNPNLKIVFLKCLVTTMNPLRNEKKSKIPWEKIQFVLCVFIATITDRTRQKYKFIDNYFQLVIHEKFAWDTLRVLLSTLNEEQSQDNKWTGLDEKYNTIKKYYLLLKIGYHIHIMEEFKLDIDKKEYHRALQIIGECFVQLTKLKFCDDDDFKQPSGNLNLFATVLVEERHKLCHFFNLNYNPNVKIPKLGIFILNMIQIVRTKIQKNAVKEFLEIVKENSMNELHKRVKDITIHQCTNEWLNFNFTRNILIMVDWLKQLPHNTNTEIKINDFANKIETCLRAYTDNYPVNSFFNFVKWFQKTQNPEKETVVSKINSILFDPVVDIKTVFKWMKNLLSYNSKSLNAWFSDISDDFVLHEQKPISDDEQFIMEMVSKIRNGIRSDEGKVSFNVKVSELLEKRNLLNEYKIFGKPETIIERWPGPGKMNEGLLKRYKDPLGSMIEKRDKNMLYFKIAIDFLTEIHWDANEIQAIAEEVKKEPQVRLLPTYFNQIKKHDSKSNMNLLDSFEILRKKEIALSTDYNYLDFFCPIPVGRNLRNYLAHGDICVDILFPDMTTVIDSQLQAIKNYDNIKQRILTTIFGVDENLVEKFFKKHRAQNYKWTQNKENPIKFGFSTSDDFVTVTREYEQQKIWATESWESFNWETEKDLQKILNNDRMIFKMRDQNGLTMVHYSLKKVNKKNPFLMFSIKNVTKPAPTKRKHIFAIMLDDAKDQEYDRRIRYDINDLESINFFIDDFINNGTREIKRSILAHILCFNCEDLDIFKSVFSLENVKPTDGFLQIASAHNQQKIVNFLLEHDYFRKNINTTYKGFSALSFAVYNNNVEIVSILLEAGADVNTIVEGDIEETLKMDIMLRNFKSLNLKTPAFVAAKNGNLEILEILLKRGANIGHFSHILINIMFNSDPKICKFIIEKQKPTLKPDENRIILHTICTYERLELLKYFIEEVLSIDYWNEIKKTILSSCYNLSSKEFMEYLLEKGAVIDKEYFQYACYFGTSDVIQMVVDKTKRENLFSTEEISAVGDKNVVQVLLDAGFPIDLEKNDHLPLEFFLGRNPSPDFIKKRMLSLLSNNFEGSVKKLINYLNDNEISVPISVLNYVCTELQLKNCKWLTKFKYEENQNDFNELLKLSSGINNNLFSNIGLQKGGSIHNASIDRMNLPINYISKEELIYIDDAIKSKVIEYETKDEKFILETEVDKSAGNVTEAMIALSKKEVQSRFGIDFYKFRPEDQFIFGILKRSNKHIKQALQRSDGNIGTSTSIVFKVALQSIPNLKENINVISPFRKLLIGIVVRDLLIVKEALKDHGNVGVILSNIDDYLPILFNDQIKSLEIVRELTERHDQSAIQVLQKFKVHGKITHSL